MMAGDGFNKFGRSRSERSNFSSIGFDLMDPNARQIYLIFPADSSFVEDDVSNYFSIFGPVQDVRIPYQQKRMFVFVTFVYPETVKLILAKGNPYFVCDCRVLVKPYKEKGKIEKKHYQHHQLDLDRGEYGVSNEDIKDKRIKDRLHIGHVRLIDATEIDLVTWNVVFNTAKEEMKRILEESRSNLDGPMTEFEASLAVLGKKSGHMRGKGRVVYNQSGTSPLQLAQANRIKMLEKELEEMNSKVKIQDKKLKVQESSNCGK